MPTATFSAAGFEPNGHRVQDHRRDTAKGRAVTVAIDAMSFVPPVRVGDVLRVYTALERIGRSSMAIRIEAWAQRFLSSEEGKVTNAKSTFVAIDDSGRPRSVIREEATK